MPPLSSRRLCIAYIKVPRDDKSVHAARSKKTYNKFPNASTMSNKLYQTVT